MNKTKILVTIGPSSANYDVVKAFIREGVSGFRINFSHGDPNTWDNYLKLISEAEEELGQYTAIIGDLRGPQIRIGDIESFEVKRGDKVTLIYSEKSSEEKTIPVSNKKIFESIEPGDIILLDDGRLRFHVQETSNDMATLIALTDGVIKPRKTIIVSGKDLELPVLTQYDIECIKYSVSRKFTYLALSYARSRRDIITLRDILDKLGGENIGIIAKIETKSAMRNLHGIVKEADAVIIARGDLGMHYSLEKIPMLQKRIAKESLAQGKPVIVATQLLESMMDSPQPSRSEIVDVINAVRDYVDALLLTNETAVGKYPVETVKWLKKIIREAEEWILIEQIPPSSRVEEPPTLRDKYAKGLVLLAESLNAKILVYTKTGLMPSSISKFRPRIQVFAGSSNIDVVRRISIYNGIKPLLVGGKGQTYDYEQGLNKLYEKLVEEGDLMYGDILVLTYGKREEALYVIKIVQVI